MYIFVSLSQLRKYTEKTLIKKALPPANRMEKKLLLQLPSTNNFIGKDKANAGIAALKQGIKTFTMMLFHSNPSSLTISKGLTYNDRNIDTTMPAIERTTGDEPPLNRTKMKINFNKLTNGG